MDKDSGLVHTVEATSANVHDVIETSKLLTGEEKVVYGDSGYLGAGNVMMRSSATRPAAKSNTKSTVVHPK